MKKRTRWIAILLMMVLLCCASCAKKDGAGEQAVAGERVESSAEEKQPTAQTPSKPTEEQPKDQPTEENDGQTEEPQKQESEQPTDSMVERVETNGIAELVRITDDALKETLGYDIYYYQLENFYIDVDGKETELRQALKNDPKVLDLLYAEWKKDHGTTGMYNDGGTITYPYEKYYAVKCNFGIALTDHVVQDLILADTENAAHQAWDDLRDRKKSEYMIRVVYSKPDALTCLTEGALGDHFDYEIYYYGISGLIIEIDGKNAEFRKAITQDPTVLDRLYDQWEQQCGSDYKAYDGGSVCYDFGEYRIYKLNAIEWDDATQTDKVRKDLIITTPSISLDEAKEATK